MTKYDIIKLIRTCPEEPVCQIYFSRSQIKDLIYILSETASLTTVSNIHTLTLGSPKYLRIGRNPNFPDMYTGTSKSSYSDDYAQVPYTPTTTLFTKV